MKIELVKKNSPQFMQAMALLIPQLSPTSPIPDSQEIDAILSFPGSTIWVATDPQEEIVGMLTLAIYQTPTGRHAWIEDVVVDQSYRHEGYGQALTSRAIEHAHQQGVKAVSLTSRPQRAAANQLYQKMGFQKIATNLYRLELNR